MKGNNWRKVIRRLDNFTVKKGLTSFVNPFSMLLLENQDKVADNINYWHVDGISLVNKINRHFDKNLQRYSFDDTSLAPIVFEFAKGKKLKIAIIGTKEEFIGGAVRNIEKKYAINVVYYRNGYMNETEKAECFSEIISSQIDMVICGMGTPYQELFLIELQQNGWYGYGYTCGGYLHQIAKRESYYPKLFDNLNIRWIYRIWDEPKLFSRYFLDYPLFFLKLFFLKKNIKEK
jgi:exopolysaccharide biosynthesis WecB/TagA/CpsF family protein